MGGGRDGSISGDISGDMLAEGDGAEGDSTFRKTREQELEMEIMELRARVSDMEGVEMRRKETKRELEKYQLQVAKSLQVERELEGALREETGKKEKLALALADTQNKLVLSTEEGLRTRILERTVEDLRMQLALKEEFTDAEKMTVVVEPSSNEVAAREVQHRRQETDKLLAEKEEALSASEGIRKEMEQRIGQFDRAMVDIQHVLEASESRGLDLEGRVKELEDALTGRGEQIEKMGIEVDALERQVSKLLNVVDDAERRLAEKTEEAGRVRVQLEDALLSLAKAEDDCQSSRVGCQRLESGFAAEVEAFRKRESVLEESKSFLEAKVANSEFSLAQALHELGVKTEKEGRWESSYAAEQMRAADLECKLANCESVVAGLEHHLAMKEEELEKKGIEMEAASEASALTETTLKELQAKVDVLQQELVVKSSALEVAEGGVQSLEQKMIELSSVLMETCSRLGGMREEAHRKDQEFADLSSRERASDVTRWKLETALQRAQEQVLVLAEAIDKKGVELAAALNAASSAEIKSEQLERSYEGRLADIHSVVEGVKIKLVEKMEESERKEKELVSAMFDREAKMAVIQKHAEEKAARAETALEEARHNFRDVQEKWRDAERRAEELERTRELLEKRIGEKQEQEEGLLQQLAAERQGWAMRLEKTIGESQGQMSEVEQRLASELLESESKASAATAALALLAVERDRGMARQDELETDLEESRSKCARWEADMKGKLETDLAESQRKCVMWEAEVNDRLTEVLELRESLEAARAELGQLRSQLAHFEGLEERAALRLHCAVGEAAERLRKSELSLQTALMKVEEAESRTQALDEAMRESRMTAKEAEERCERSEKVDACLQAEMRADEAEKKVEQLMEYRNNMREKAASLEGALQQVAAALRLSQEEGDEVKEELAAALSNAESRALDLEVRELQLRDKMVETERNRAAEVELAVESRLSELQKSLEAAMTGKGISLRKLNGELLLESGGTRMVGAKSGVKKKDGGWVIVEADAGEGKDDVMDLREGKRKLHTEADMRNQVELLEQELRSVREANQQAAIEVQLLHETEASLRAQVAELQQRLEGMLEERASVPVEPEKKSFRDVTIEGELACLKLKAAESDVLRARVSELEQKLKDAELREHRQLASILQRDGRILAAEERVRELEHQLGKKPKGDEELAETLLHAAEKVQIAEAQAVSAKGAEEEAKGIAAALQDTVRSLESRLKSIAMEKARAKKEIQDARKAEVEIQQVGSETKLVSSSERGLPGKALVGHAAESQASASSSRKKRSKNGAKLEDSATSTPISAKIDPPEAAMETHHKTKTGGSVSLLRSVLTHVLFVALALGVGYVFSPVANS